MPMVPPLSRGIDKPTRPLCQDHPPRSMKVLILNHSFLWLRGHTVPLLGHSSRSGGCHPANMTPLHLNVGGIKRVYECQVVWCSDRPSTSRVAICTHVCWDHLGVKLVCPSCPWSFLKSDVLRQHKKKVHTSGSPNPHSLVPLCFWVRKVTSAKNFIVKAC